jgi:hypothetical protein
MSGSHVRVRVRQIHRGMMGGVQIAAKVLFSQVRHFFCKFIFLNARLLSMFHENEVPPVSLE